MTRPVRSDADSWTGRLLGGRWRILSLLDDSGGMASVYLADDERLPRKAVIKVPKAAQFNAEFAARFEREAFYHARAENLHVVNILDRGTEDGTPFLVLQYLPGGNLKDWAARNPSILADPRLHFDAWIMPIAQALDAVAAQGIVHRDVKPSNILFDASGQAYLSDFGIVKAGSEATMTGTGVFIGTLQFMSPEQCQSESKRLLDGRSDQYGLAVTVYQVLTGWKYPVEDDTAVIYAAKFGHIASRPPSSHEPRLPRAVDDVVMRALAADRDRRFATSVDFARAVLSALEGRPASHHAPPMSGTASLGEAPAGKRPSGAARGRSIAIVGGFAALLLTAVVLAAWYRLRPEERPVDPPPAPLSLASRPPITAPPAAAPQPAAAPALGAAALETQRKTRKPDADTLFAEGQTPDRSCAAFVRGVSRGDAAALWQLLPASYRRDVERLKDDWADEIDAATWGEIHSAVRTCATLARKKEDFLLGCKLVTDGLTSGATPEFDAAAIKAAVQSCWPLACDLLDELAAPEFSSPDRVKAMPAEKVVQSIGNPLAALIIAALSESKDPTTIKNLATFRRSTFESVRRDGQFFVTWHSTPDDESGEDRFIVVDGRWLPAELAETVWPQMIAASDAAVTQFEVTPAIRERIVGIARAVKTNGEKLLAAESQEAFDDACMVAFLDLTLAAQPAE